MKILLEMCKSVILVELLLKKYKKKNTYCKNFRATIKTTNISSDDIHIFLQYCDIIPKMCFFILLLLFLK